jgi:NAD(P)-dependent dehydrogenase (short-subunit alcohol dehydrogenase family)
MTGQLPDLGGEELRGQVVLITGGSRGIGAAVAAAVVAAGGAVCITGRDERALKESLQRLDAGERALAETGEADDPAHQRRTVERILERHGRLDALVNNAATAGPPKLLVHSEEKDLRQALETNAIAAWSWAREVWHAWMGEHGGQIVNVASIAGLQPERGIGAYGVSKAALIHLTRLLALEMAPQVRVNAVAPGLVATDATRSLWEGRESDAAQVFPLRRIGRPGDVGAVVRFLLSPESGWMTGQTLVVDGGHTLTLSPAAEWLAT